MCHEPNAVEDWDRNAVQHLVLRVEPKCCRTQASRDSLHSLCGENECCRIQALKGYYSLCDEPNAVKHRH